MRVAARSENSLITEPSVRVYIASWNTRTSTELTIRTARRLAGYPFELIVGDGGSGDGSVEMLRQLHDMGWLRLELERGGRLHAEWLDRWTATCECDYACFVDSDVEFLQPGWLRSMVKAATEHDAHMVYSESLDGAKTFTVPRSGETVELTPRPAPWLFLVDAHAARTVQASFAERAVEVEGARYRRVYDVGAWFFLEARKSGLRMHLMDPAFRRVYRHFGGTSWRRTSARRWVGLSNETWIEQRLRVARACDEGDRWTASRVGTLTNIRVRLSRAIELARKAVRPSAHRDRRERGRRSIPWTDPGSG